MKKNYDFLVVGAGVVGLTIARALARRGAGSVLVLEKEPALGRHASGRNSGVVHAGIYYAPGTFKAKVCVQGARMLRDYAEQNRLPILKVGKVIVASRPELAPMVDELYRRAQANGARAEIVSESRLREIEPQARTFEKALFSPDTAMVDPLSILAQLEKDLVELQVTILKSTPVVRADAEIKTVQTPGETFGFGYLINTAGLYADRIAHLFGVGLDYRVLPFKGIYSHLQPAAAARFRTAIYAVPDLNMPFLGVHITKTVKGEGLVGPTAIPALGRENYGILAGMDPTEMPVMLRDLARMFIRNHSNFRNFAVKETSKYLPGGLFHCARELAPSLKPQDFVPGICKTGLRAQLVNTKTLELVMDFLAEDGKNSLHILNAVSPGFTASLYFAELMTDRILQKSRSSMAPMTTGD